MAASMPAPDGEHLLSLPGQDIGHGIASRTCAQPCPVELYELGTILSSLSSHTLAYSSVAPSILECSDPAIITRVG